MLKSRRIRCDGNLARMGKMRHALWGVGGECQKERDHQEDQDVGGWIVLSWILER
jgi:hypothetical protein